MATATISNNALNQKMHVLMLPWFAFGHFTPYLHLANILAQRGHRVSFLAPNKAILQLQDRNLHPHLITFHPLTLPAVQGLPPEAETASDVPYSSHTLLAKALDLTRDQVEALVSRLAPDFIFYDFAHWVPELVATLEVKTVFYAVVAATCVCAPVTGTMTMKIAVEFDLEFGIGITFLDRIITAFTEASAVCFRTCMEVEGDIVEYMRKTCAKRVLLTGPLLPEEDESKLDPKWEKWLSTISPSSKVIFCTLGTQITLDKDQFQELILGFEETGLPFLAVLKPPVGCFSVEEAMPEGFKERVEGRGVVYNGWVQQTLILKHASVGCFVSHCGFGSMWEGLVSECQIVALPFLPDQFSNAKIMADKLKAAVVIEREDGDNGRFSKEKVCEAIKSVMDEDSEIGLMVRKNHSKYKEVLTKEGFMSGYIDKLVEDLQELKNV